MDNVINLFSVRTRSKDAGNTQVISPTSSQMTVRQEKVLNNVKPQASIETSSLPDSSDFASVAARNKANQDRLKKEREQANKNVLKSYRIK